MIAISWEEFKSAESRVSKLVSDFDAILVRLSMEGFAETEGKLTVDYLSKKRGSATIATLLDI